MLSKAPLKNTDLVVSQLCYGANQLGTAVDQAGSNALLDRFASLGGNFIDTARSYGDWIPTAPAGASERAIGAWLRGKTRSDFVIATKGGMVDMRAGDWANRANPTAITSDLTESLEHLGVATIDLYWLHADNPQAPVGPIIDALIGHEKAGRIRYFGASNWTPARILEAQAYAKSVGHRGFVAVQPFWGLAAPNRDFAATSGYGPYYEDGFAEVHDVLPMVPYSAQSRGWFTKVAKGGEESAREDLAGMYRSDTNRARLKAVQAVAARRGVSLNEVVLAYLLSQPKQTIPIIGAVKPDQLDDSAKAVALKLTADELRELAVG